MTAFVTGGTGFVGSALIRRLLATGHRVRALVRPGSSRKNIEGLDVETVTGDLSDATSLRRALRGCESLFHVAADYRLWVPEPSGMYRANVDGTCNIMLAALGAGVPRVVYTSSVATLKPRSDGGESTEADGATEREVAGHYKKSKVMAETAVRLLVEKRGLPAVIVNPSTPVGPGDVKPTPTGRVLLSAITGRMPAYVNTGLNLVHVDDVAEGHMLALEKGRAGERYILGAENMTLREILDELASITGGAAPRWRLSHNFVLPLAMLSEAWARLSRKAAPLLTVDGARMAKRHMFYSSEKAKRALGYRPRPAKEALAEAVEWFIKNGYCRQAGHNGVKTP